MALQRFGRYKKSCLSSAGFVTLLHGVQLISKPNISQNGLIYLARLQILESDIWPPRPKQTRQACFANKCRMQESDLPITKLSDGLSSSGRLKT
jgi:hypothetical protein